LKLGETDTAEAPCIWWSSSPKMWWPATLCGQDGGGQPPFFVLDLFLIFYYFVFNLFLKVRNKILLFFNTPRGRLMALGSLRRDTSHQLDALVYIKNILILIININLKKKKGLILLYIIYYICKYIIMGWLFLCMHMVVSARWFVY
jgi:hypothetical protein